MVVKIYWLIWAAIILSAVAIMAVGEFSNMVAVIYGFIGFGLTFMGMIGVLPNIISHPDKPEATVARPLNVEKALPRSRASGMLKSA